MQWIMLLLAGISEITWAYFMKLSNGFTKVVPSITTLIFYVLSAVFLSLALKNFRWGTAHAMWTGFGIVGTSVLGILIYKETLNAAQIICIVLIVCGIVGFKIF